MNNEIIHKIERIEKMLDLLLNEEQKEEIKQFDIEYYNRKKGEIYIEPYYPKLGELNAHLLRSVNIV